MATSSRFSLRTLLSEVTFGAVVVSGVAVVLAAVVDLLKRLFITDHLAAEHLPLFYEAGVVGWISDLPLTAIITFILAFLLTWPLFFVLHWGMQKRDWQQQWHYFLVGAVFLSAIGFVPPFLLILWLFAEALFSHTPLTVINSGGMNSIFFMIIFFASLGGAASSLFWWVTQLRRRIPLA